MDWMPITRSYTVGLLPSQAVVVASSRVERNAWIEQQMYVHTSRGTSSTGDMDW